MIANHRYSLSRKPFFEHFLGRRRGGGCLYKYLQNTWLFKSTQSSEISPSRSRVLLDITQRQGEVAKWTWVKSRTLTLLFQILRILHLYCYHQSTSLALFCRLCPFRNPLLIPLKFSLWCHPCLISEWCLPNIHWLHCHSHLPTTIPLFTLFLESRPEQSAQPERALTVFTISGDN